MIENKYEFQIEDKDDASEKFEILAMKMDLHKSGILFVNELVYNLLVRYARRHTSTTERANS